MKRAIVTGATGFIGVSLVNQLIHVGYNVVAVIRPHSVNANRLKPNSQLTILELDQSMISELFKYLNEPYDVFYHLAWEGIRTPKNQDKGLQEQNYRASMQALQTAKQCGCIRFISTGSQAEYGIINGIVDEETTEWPITEYGKAKLRTSREGRILAKEFGIQFIWARIFSVYGKYDYEYSLVNQCIQKMLRDETILLSDCTQFWDYLYVEDAARALLLLGNKQCPNGVYNIASGESRPLKEFVLEIKEIIHSKSDLQFGAVPHGISNPVNLQLKVDKLKKTIDWEPTTMFKKGIENMVQLSKEIPV